MKPTALTPLEVEPVRLVVDPRQKESKPVARITVYGSKSVVKELAEFLDAGGTIKRDGCQSTDLVEAMRHHAGTKKMRKDSESANTLLARPGEA